MDLFRSKESKLRRELKKYPDDPSLPIELLSYLVYNKKDARKARQVLGDHIGLFMERKREEEENTGQEAFGEVSELLRELEELEKLK